MIHDAHTEKEASDRAGCEMLFKISTDIFFAVILHSAKQGKGFKHYKSFESGVQSEIDSKRV